MRLCSLFFLLILTSFSLNSDADRSTCNDTLVEQCIDKQDLLKYLNGSWTVKGTWQVIEGKGKVKYASKATLSGTETYKPVLDGHFLEKNLNAKVSYYSRDLGKKVVQTFSSLNMYTFNQNLGLFTFWYFDSSGAFLDAKGSYTEDGKEYVFNTETLDLQGDVIQAQHVIQIVSETQYNWEVRQKSGGDYEWSTSASGTATRKS